MINHIPLKQSIEKLCRFKQFGAIEWAVVLLIIASLVRLLWISDIPGGLNQDEASSGYDAWALLTEGIDRHGVSWPVHFISWGSGQNALYAYLAMPFIAIGGLNVTTLRLPAALMGIMCLWIFWRLGRRQDKQMALWALLLIATSPWHIMASRWALESNALPGVVLVAVYCFVRAGTNMAWLPLASGVLAASVYAYGTAYFFAPLFMLCAWIVVAQEQKIRFKWLSLSTLCAFLTALPIIVFIANNTWGSGHLFWGPLGIPKYPGEARYSGMFLPLAPDGFALIPDNAIQVLRMLLGGQSDGLPWNASSSWGPQYWILTPFLMLGIAHTINHKILTDRLMLAWFGCALITAFCTSANINRINVIWLPSLWLAARGLWLLHPHALLNRLAQISLLSLGIIFVLHYFYSWQERITQSFFPGLGESLQTAIKEAPVNAPITITGNSVYTSSLFFIQPKPSEYLATAVIPDPLSPFHNLNSFGRFRFGITPEQMPWENYWVAHVSELQLFSLMNFNIKSHGNYSWITRKPTQELACYESLELAGLYGKQDVGALGINYEVESTEAGLPIAGQRFYAGLGVHGDSEWNIALTQPASALEVGVGLSSNSGCSDGITFKLLADDKLVFNSKIMKPGELAFHKIPFGQASKLTFVTESGYSNRCDHGLWITPVIKRCNN